MSRLCLWVPLLVGAGLVGGCDRQQAPDPSIHDTKFVAIGHNGEPTAVGVRVWPCVLDQYTGLMWEGKDESPGLHDWRNTYTWYSPNESHDQGLDYRGTANGGACAGSGCDTTEFVAAVNAAGYCGRHDWRLPTRDELATISDPRKLRAPPTLNTALFLHARPDEYWSANDYSFQWDAAWVWSFANGQDRVEWKRSPRPVRLVSGEGAHVAASKD